MKAKHKEKPFYLAQMFPIKSLPKTLVTGVLLFLPKLKVIRFMHTECFERIPGLDASPVYKEQCGTQL